MIATAAQHRKLEIVAELAQGFEGKPEQTELLLRAAAAAGADAAKVQLVYADELATPDYKYYDLFKSLEMSDEVWTKLFSQARDRGLALYFDVFGERSLALAVKLGVTTVKLHGTDISNLGFLKAVAASDVPRVMLGAGGALAEEIEQAIALLKGKDIVILLGFQSYPTPNDTNQIARVRKLADRWEASGHRVTMGFADHAPPDNPTRFSLAATAIGAGAVVVEKHLTLSQNLKLEDHESALNPDEFAEFCAVIRDSFAALGDSAEQSDFGMSESEVGYRKMIRRHAVSARDLQAGTVLTPDDVVLKRCGAEEPITDLAVVYGKTLNRPIAANSAILTTDLQSGGSQ